MCLYLLQTCSCKDCCACCSSCCRAFCKTCNPLGILFNILIGFPIALIIMLLSGLVEVILNWLPATYNLTTAMWQHVCITLKRGRQAYAGDAHNTRDPTLDCCSAAAAECYCCLLPAFVLATILMPLWTLLFPLLIVFIYAFSGACAGCVGIQIASWWPSVSRVLRRMDAQLTADARRPDSARLCTCLLGEDHGQQLPTHHAPNTVAGAHVAQPEVHPQSSAHHRANNPDPMQSLERAARDIATNVLAQGVQSLFSAATRPPPTTAQPATAVPRAVPVGRPVVGRRVS